ncbi:hypothetical protein ABFS82_13G022400 [Erythranthe guttata]|nr:PREDICTED: myb-related protein Myb4-like [Erythranthe guttata]|eukprot:XP_012852429.1 PREDICTED: myb-related protein Myb4-like [Erythranthe guttata]
MVRAPFYDKNGVKKGAWSEEEDNKLKAYILRYGHWNWRLLPKFAGLERCGKSCRLRWVNYLKPGVKKGNFSKQEEDLIVELHAQLGKRWSVIAAKLPGRTDNDIKNFWHTRIRKREPKNPTAEIIITNPSSTTTELASCEESVNKSASSNNTTASSSLSFDDDNLWDDIFQLADINNNSNNDFFPPLASSDENYYFSDSQLHYTSELPSSNSCYDYCVGQMVDRNFSGESFELGYGSGSSYVPIEEAGGGVYDCFVYYDDGMNLFS